MTREEETTLDGNIFVIIIRVKKGGEKRMKKILSIVVGLTVLTLTPFVVSAQGVQQQNRVQDPTTHEVTTTPQGNQVQNQNQIQTQNQGEEQQLMVATQQMQQLMDMESSDEEAGEKVRNIAQQQVQAQDQIQTQIEKMESKSALMKRLFGPDYSAIKNLKQQMEQNQQRIQQLQMLSYEVENEGNEAQLQESINSLIQQNIYLQEKIQAEEKVGGIFGWLIRLFQ